MTGNRDRGQTPVDFGIGAGIFVVAMVFVVAFVPTLTAPFDRGAGEQTVAADRVATKLAEGLLGSQRTPATLDADCTVGFFDDRDTACGYESGVPLTDQFGLQSYRNVAVELRSDLDGDGSDERLCWDSSTETIISAPCSSPDVEFRAGDDGESASTAVSRRSVAVETVGATMIVRVW